MAKTSKILLFGGIGIAAYYLYTKYGSGAGVLSPVPTVPPVSGGNVSYSTLTQVSAASAIPGQYGSNTPINPNATLDQQTTLFNWATAAMGVNQPGDLAQFMKMYPKFTASDIAGLLDLINTGFSSSPAHTAFWNNWRAQYDIDNGTYA